MLRIAYIQNMRLPTEKAHGYQIMKTCEALMHTGASVELHIPNRKTNILEKSFSYYDIKPTFKISRHPVIDWIGLAPIFLKQAAFVLERWSFSRSLQKNLPLDANVFFTRDPWLAAQIKRCTNKPIFLELHALPNNKTIKQLHGIAGILCLTKWMQTEINKHLPDMRTAFLPDAVDLDVFDPTITRSQARTELDIPQEAHIVAYGGKFSTMEQGKGLAMLDQAVSDLSKSVPDLQLYLIGGSKEEFTKLEGKIPATSTSCIAQVDRKKLATYYRAADVLVMPFPNTHHYAFEMSPLKLFEYMVSGTPIITSDLPSIRDILDEKSAYFFQADNTASLAQELREAFNNTEKSVKLATSAHRLGHQYTWDNRATSILSFIQQI